MPPTEKDKRKFVAIARQLKEQKGIVIKKSDINKMITTLKEGQKENDKIKEEYSDSKAVELTTKENNKKLQAIINELNEYMKVLHPEGLLDLGSGSSGQSVVSQG